MKILVTLLTLIASSQAFAIGGGGQRFEVCGPEFSLSQVRPDNVVSHNPVIQVSLRLHYQECKTEVGTRFTKYGLRALVHSTEGELPAPVQLEEIAERSDGSGYAGVVKARALNSQTAVAEFSHYSPIVDAARRHGFTNVQLVTLRVLVGGELATEIQFRRAN